MDDGHVRFRAYNDCFESSGVWTRCSVCTLLRCPRRIIGGSLLIQYLAFIYAWTGEKDRAFEQLAIAARMPGPLSYGQLRLHPYWDPLRGDPRFDKIVASLAPKS